ncbi:uncharacterized protein K460DRAFT_368325 [Cucurbitaria berberidis CBS 394.84]|uniref:Uncharacterized protein n=1 Tax=Cucurbitaria berberidis CBS 394.84 TaxID=1168544 RepID=A0A9P4L655_9PLEO|nr:uncharacterized protein K460DRAFT_368325 [Cucurbitaria berberidis CBS 394.84]KAF1843425.1 hypothetical protein K460DRAFT_368325 [Cucurbitaria berberidis CBS 394.84]
MRTFISTSVLVGTLLWSANVSAAIASRHVKVRDEQPWSNSTSQSDTQPSSVQESPNQSTTLQDCSTSVNSVVYVSHIIPNITTVASSFVPGSTTASVNCTHEDCMTSDGLPNPPYAFPTPTIGPPNTDLQSDKPILSTSITNWNSSLSACHTRGASASGTFGAGNSTAMSSVMQISTTFITSVQSYSSSSSSAGNSSTIADAPAPPPPEPTPTPPEPIPTPPTPPTKALSIILRKEVHHGSNKNSWTFFPTTVGAQADGCDKPLLQAHSWESPKDRESPPWPRGNFTMRLFGEAGCTYSNKGEGAGVLRCPSMAKEVECQEDGEKGDGREVTQCVWSPGLARVFHRVAFCEW